MLELVKYIAQSLVENPDAVERGGEGRPPSRSFFELHVAPEDMGKVIGRQGRIAKAIRTLVKAATVKDEKPVFVEIV